MREAHGVTRRALMGGSLALAVAACQPAGNAPRADGTDPDVLALRRALSAEQRLLARYDAVRRRHPDLADRIDPIAAEHRHHARALAARVTPSPEPTPTPTASPGDGWRAPPDAAEATRGLADLERAAAADRVDDLFAVPPFLAQLLASISASETTHAELLAGRS